VHTNIPGRPLEYASTILACIAVVVTAPIMCFTRRVRTFVRGQNLRNPSIRLEKSRVLSVSRCLIRVGKMVLKSTLKKLNWVK